MRRTVPTWLIVAALAGLRLVTARGDAPSLVHSLSVELLLLALIAAAGLRWLWPARVALLALLWAELLAAGVFLSLGAYLRGADLVGIHGGDVAPVVFGRLSSVPLLSAFLGAALLALRWAPRKPRLIPAAVSAAVLLVCAIAAFQQLRDPDAMPPPAHSPLALLADFREDPAPSATLPNAPPHEEDWAPPAKLAARWQALAQRPRMNVVLVVLESVGDRFAHTPNLEALAQHGVRFTRAYAHDPRSIKELDALLFGVYPWPSRANLSWHDGDIALDSLPARWHALGLHTAYFYTGDLGFESQRALVQPRFDEVTDAIRDRSLYEQGDRELVRDFARLKAPFGAVLWMMQTHVPYWLPKPQHTQAAPFSEGAFEEALRDEDAVLGALVQTLRDEGHLDDTIIALVGDHGQSFGEHPENGKAHGLWLFDENTHVPLILSNPKLFHGETDDTILQLKDVPATLAWLAGDPRGVLNEGACAFFDKPQTAYLVNFLGGGLRGAVVRGRYKYQLDATTSDERLYDLQSDPGETRNVAAAHPAETADARQRWAGWYRTWLSRWKQALNPAHVRRADAVARALLGQR